MSDPGTELDRALGVTTPADTAAALAALAVEHGVLELPPTGAKDEMSEKLISLLALVDAAPAAKQVALLLGGAAKLASDAQSEGPAVVAHLSADLRAEAVKRFAVLVEQTPGVISQKVAAPVATPATPTPSTEAVK